jgi:hypothetical protein
MSSRNISPTDSSSPSGFSPSDSSPSTPRKQLNSSQSFLVYDRPPPAPWVQQLRALLWKAWMQRRMRPWSLSSEIFLPLLMLGMMAAMEASLKAWDMNLFEITPEESHSRFFGSKLVSHMCVVGKNETASTSVGSGTPQTLAYYNNATSSVSDVAGKMRGFINPAAPLQQNQLDNYWGRCSVDSFGNSDSENLNTAINYYKDKTRFGTVPAILSLEEPSLASATLPSLQSLAASSRHLHFNLHLNQTLNQKTAVMSASTPGPGVVISQAFTPTLKPFTGKVFARNGVIDIVNAFFNAELQLQLERAGAVMNATNTTLNPGFEGLGTVFGKHSGFDGSSNSNSAQTPYVQLTIQELDKSTKAPKTSECGWHIPKCQMTFNTPIWLAIASMVPYMGLIAVVAGEKETINLLRDRQMYSSAYWFSWLLISCGWMVLMSFVITSGAYIMGMWTHSNFLLVWLVLSLG